MKVRLKIESGGRAGLSLVELLVLLAVIAVIALIGFGTASRPMKTKSPGMRCVNNLKNIGLSFRIFATENGDRFPPAVMMGNGVELTSIDLLMVYRSMSNLLSTPRLLHCPTDTKRKQADASINFDTMTLKNVSYFTSLSADETMPEVLLAGDRNLATNGVAVGSGLFALTTNGAALSWTRDMHKEEGNVAMGDGSVQQMSSMRLKEQVREQQFETNYLLIP